MGCRGGGEDILELSPNSLLSSCQRSSKSSLMMKLISGKVVHVGAGAETGDDVPGIVDIGIGGTVWVTGDALEIGSAGLGFADIVDSCCIMTAWLFCIAIRQSVRRPMTSGSGSEVNGGNKAVKEACFGWRHIHSVHTFCIWAVFGGFL